MEERIALTGIKPSGTVHLGNLLGAIKPGIELTREYRAFYFIADYHALTTVHDPALLRRLSAEVAAAWIALGLDLERAVVYRQSDVQETFELAWILSCHTPKGLLNRAHAYKAAVAQNQELGRTEDAGVNVGLFNYPLLMAADILIVGSDVVPVGLDQKQHVEIARDVAKSFNKTFRPLLTEPRVLIRDSVKTVPGLDGRKMSKSYGNVIPLFADDKDLRRAVAQIKTDAAPPDAPKDPESSTVFILYSHFAPEEQVEEMRRRFVTGTIGYQDAKDALYRALVDTLTEPRERYAELLRDEASLEEVLAEGASAARSRAADLMAEIRDAVGVPRLRTTRPPLVS